MCPPKVLPECVLGTLCELDHASSLLQEVELWEACQYGLVEQVHYLLTSGVNINVNEFVSGQYAKHLEMGMQLGTRVSLGPKPILPQPCT